jgi:hypothetical protein
MRRAGAPLHRPDDARGRGGRARGAQPRRARLRDVLRELPRRDGSGQGPAARSLVKPPRDFRAADFAYASGGPGELPTDADLDLTIRKGRVENGMPAWQGLTDPDRHAVIQFIKTFSPRWQ